MALDLVDIGANLTHDSFDADREEVIALAREAGVRRMVLTGSSVTASRDALSLAESQPDTFFATAGVHPHHARDYDDAAHAAIRELCSHEKVRAVGECGLDYFRNFSSPDAQRAAFELQLDIAVETGLPVFLHQRDAHDDFMNIVAPRMPSLSRGVAHCFTGSEQELKDCLELDLYIGITGWICDERRGSHLQDIVGLIPDDRLMIETDAPYLLPRTLKPKPKSRRNEPRYLREVLRVVAAARGVSEAALARTTTETAEVFFEL